MSANGNADLVFTNGAVYTVDAARRWARAVAVKGGRIVAVGTDDDVARPDRRPAPRSSTSRGRMLLPGFQDAHVHPVSGGLDLLQCDLHDAGRARPYSRRSRRTPRAHPDARVDPRRRLVDGRRSPAARRRRSARPVVPDRPVFLPNRDGHGAWVNSRALELAGITRDTPDPADGRIERDADGEPPARCTRARCSSSATCARLDPDEWTPACSRPGVPALARHHRLAGRDRGAVRRACDNFDAYLRRRGEGALTARVVGALWWDRDARARADRRAGRAARARPRPGGSPRRA